MNVYFIGESKNSLGFLIPRTGCQIFLVEFGFWIPIFSRIPDSLSYNPNSKAQDSGLHKKKISWIPESLDSLTWDESLLTHHLGMIISNGKIPLSFCCL